MRIINLVENELGESGCEAAHGLSFYIETENHKLLFDSSLVEINPRARIYMQHNAGGEYYAFDGEEKGYRYIGIDKKILSLPQVELLKGDAKIDDELQLFIVDERAYPLPSTNKRLRELCDGQYIQDEFYHEQNLLLTAGGKKILFTGRHRRSHRNRKSP